MMSVESASLVVLETDELNEYNNIEEEGDKEEAINCELGSVESLVQAATGDPKVPREEPGQNHGDLEGRKEPKVAVLIPGLDGAGENNIVTMDKNENMIEFDFPLEDVTAGLVLGSQVPVNEEEKKVCLELGPVVTNVDTYNAADAGAALANEQAAREKLKQLKEELDEVKEYVKCEAQKYLALGMYVDMTLACASDVDAVADRNSRYETALALVRASSQKIKIAEVRASSQKMKMDMDKDKVMQEERMREVEVSTLEKILERENKPSKSVCDWSVNGGQCTASSVVDEPVPAGSRSKFDEAPRGYSVSYRKPNILPGSSMPALSDSAPISHASKPHMDLGGSPAYAPRTNDFKAEFSSEDSYIGASNVGDSFKQKIMQ